MINISLNLDKDFEFILGAHEFKVRFVDKEKLKEKEGEGSYGVYQPEEKTIYVLDDMPQSLKLSTFLHEAIHAMEDIFLIKINHVQLNLISEMLTQILLQKVKK